MEDSDTTKGKCMNNSRYLMADGPRWPAIIRDAAIAVGVLILLMIIWPFYSVPTGSRGAITHFGKIVGIEPEALAVLPPRQKRTHFSIRSEQAHIDTAA